MMAAATEAAAQATIPTVSSCVSSGSLTIMGGRGAESSPCPGLDGVSGESGVSGTEGWAGTASVTGVGEYVMGMTVYGVLRSV